MSSKKLDTEGVMNELKGQSAFFGKSKSPSKVGQQQESKSQTNRLTESQTDKVSELQSDRLTELQGHKLTDFSNYETPNFRKLQRMELRITWEQKEYLDRLESIIARDMPEGERSDPNYKRITKSSIIRALVEIIRRLNLTVNASEFSNEKDLASEVYNQLSNRLTELQSDKTPE